MGEDRALPQGSGAPLEPGKPHARPVGTARHGRLAWRPPDPPGRRSPTGLITLPGGEGTDFAYVPASSGDAPMRLVVALHGAGGSGEQGLRLLAGVAEEHRLLVVAPTAQGRTWDVILGSYGPDVERIDRVLEDVSAAYPVEGLALAGFSDGASYALSLGITNGDVVDAVIAFSPGFAAPLVAHGRPRMFISHGTGDRVLPIDRCSRALAPRLERAGYAVEYHEFDGGHAVPDDVVHRAARWLAG